VNAFTQIETAKAVEIEKPFLLRELLRTLPDHERADFRETARDFASGLNSTIPGARHAMRQWVKHPPSWISAEWQARRIRFLAILETVE